MTAEGLFDTLPDAWERDSKGRRIGALSTCELLKIIEQEDKDCLVHQATA